MSTGPSSEKRWPEATNYAEAGRLSSAYREHSKDGPVSDGYDDADAFYRALTVHLRVSEQLIALAQVHATLAVADELRAFRESGREIGLAGLSPGARRDLLP